MMMMNENRELSAVVPVSEHTINIAKNKGRYYFPRGKLRRVSYLFFYEILPVGAIRYYADVKDYIEDADAQVSLHDKMLTFRDPTKEASLIVLGPLKALERPIKRKKNDYNIQSKIYKSYSEIIQAKTTQDLFNAPTGHVDK